MAQPARKIKRSQASLTGGFIVGAAVICLSMLVTGQLGWDVGARWGVSIVIGVLMGAWVRLADL